MSHLLGGWQVRRGGGGRFRCAGGSPEHCFEGRFDDGEKEDQQSRESAHSVEGFGIEELRPEGIRVTPGWDRSGRRASYRDAAGHKTTWSYDALNRTTGVTYPDSTSYTYVYDATHNLTGITDPNGTAVTQTFDDSNRRTGVSVVPGLGVVGPTEESCAYDGLHRLTAATSVEVASSVATTITLAPTRARMLTLKS